MVKFPQLYISSSWVKIRLHIEIQLPRLPASAVLTSRSLFLGSPYRDYFTIFGPYFRGRKYFIDSKKSINIDQFRNKYRFKIDQLIN